MSIAVAVRKGSTLAVAADSQENFGDRKVVGANHRATKIMSFGGSELAMTGWGVYDNVFTDYLASRRAPRFASEREIFTFFVRLWRDLRRRYSYVEDQVADDHDRSPFADLDSSFLIGNRHGIFHVSGDMSVMAFQQYYAIGSGASYALGVLHALYDSERDAAVLARRACEAAIAFDVYCGGEIDVRSIRMGDRRRPRSGR
jgi:ATP-dependent protease HslVU (ClpYQ) peptidase subunit